jgi:hypothetical protein
MERQVQHKQERREQHKREQQVQHKQERREQHKREQQVAVEVLAQVREQVAVVAEVVRA